MHLREYERDVYTIQKLEKDYLEYTQKKDNLIKKLKDLYSVDTERVVLIEILIRVFGFQEVSFVISNLNQY